MNNINFQIKLLFKRIEKHPESIKSYVWDPAGGRVTQLFAAKIKDDTYFYTHDANKNITEMIDTNLNIVAHYEYSPFGAVTASSGALATSNLFRFSNEYSDVDIGLIYYNYRHYNPLYGRWLSRDPIGERGGDNLYGMVDNKTLNQFDRLGLEAILIDSVSISASHSGFELNSNSEDESFGDPSFLYSINIYGNIACEKDENGCMKINASDFSIDLTELPDVFVCPANKHEVYIYLSQIITSEILGKGCSIEISIEILVTAFDTGIVSDYPTITPGIDQSPQTLSKSVKFGKRIYSCSEN